MIAVMEEGGWRELQGDSLCDTPHLRVFQERIATPSRPRGVDWTVVRRRPAVVVAPRTPGGKYLLIRQERVAVRRALWEFPAGQVDGPGDEDSLRETALRELGEEAGMECRGELITLGYFFSSPGFTDECPHLFLATEVVPRALGSQHDEHEAILEVGEFSADELARLIASGGIVDANTLALSARLWAKNLWV
jgi:ADP-ribose pyrophosphatase